MLHILKKEILILNLGLKRNTVSEQLSSIKVTINENFPTARMRRNTGPFKSYLRWSIRQRETFLKLNYWEAEMC